MIYIFTFLIAFGLSLFLSPLSIKISERLSIFSKPNRGETNGKPCLGGIAIYIGFLIAIVSVCFLYGIINPKVTGLFVSSLLIILLGLVDDIKELKPFEKIIVQLIAIGILILFGIVTRISFLAPWVNILITFIWVLFIANAFNLLDIVDGLTSGLVIIISLTLLGISLVNKDVFSSIVLISLIGVHAGFLRYNYPPARLYMGDTGSLFSGFLLAVVSINISYATIDRPFSLITPLLVMSIPIYDTFFLIIMRAKKGKSILSKTNDHFALRLVSLGYSVRKSLWIMYLFSMFLAVSALIIVFGSDKIGIAVLIVVFLVFVFMGRKVGMIEIND